MIALDELKKLPIEERWQIVEELTRSIEEEENDFEESPEFIAEIRARSARLKADPSSGVSWETVEKRIQARRG
jgi:putative addiction module component (TIGR02574 family)